MTPVKKAFSLVTVNGVSLIAIWASKLSVSKYVKEPLKEKRMSSAPSVPLDFRIAFPHSLGFSTFDRDKEVF